MILTDEHGRPYPPRPQREEYPDGFDGWLAWTEALYGWKQRITNDANEAFDRAFRRALATDPVPDTLRGMASPSTTKKPSPKKRKVTRTFEECSVFDAKTGVRIGKPTRTLFEQARTSMEPVWAYPSEVTEGAWSAYPNETAHVGDDEARLVKVA